MNRNNDFQPDWISAPGDTIADILEERDLPQAEFARRIGHTLSEARGLLEGREPITPELATKLQHVLGASATFWINRETQYRQDVVRLRGQDVSKGRGVWLEELPVKDMIKFGWITPASNSATANEAACLQFFDLPDVSAWRDAYRGALEMAAFRTSASFDSHPGAVAAWLRRGEIEASSIACSPWDAQKFRSALSKIRALTWKKQPDAFIPKLKELCAQCGVAVVIVRAPSGCRASGATRFLSANKAMLLLSFRYLSDDHFWFTFFHEGGHLLLHGKAALFLEGANMVTTDQEEEANKFAGEILIPPELRTELFDLPRDGRAIIKFARAVGIAPGIVVGQLQHFGRLQRNQLNALKRRFRWAGDN
jgi:plasmid maintenance system antidote protein VapI/Zn-dependent peptidase ImmA (M78 family)